LHQALERRAGGAGTIGITGATKEGKPDAQAFEVGRIDEIADGLLDGSPLSVVHHGTGLVLHDVHIDRQRLGLAL
jgi:hypothetical protein